ncbi:alpha/beta hydrolase [Chitinophaga vietnamensis]|uniref:alpha/beta hydrolase n=1 Tax=Chitinophaga vietnamensis TaxID=2593957 RepID=UPI001178BC85|nr:alpha/beta hydrolase [Chitinophaga vietnamensis]
MEQLNFPAFRQALEQFTAKDAATKDPVIQVVTDESINEELRIRIYRNRPVETKLPVFIFLHGGGWVRGSLSTHDYVCRRLAADGAFAVIAVDYRLAPEHPFPAPLEDAFQALRWVMEHAADINIDTNRIAVGGDSAGGNLALALALKAKAHAIPLKALVVAYPPVNYDFSTPSYQKFATGYALTTSLMKTFWDAYVPDDKRRLDPLASVIKNDFTALPPVLIIGSDTDPLHDDGKLLLERLMAHGVRARYSFYPGAGHAFLLMMATEGPAVLAKEEIVAFLKAQL